MPYWILLCADDMVIFEKNREQMQAVLAVVHQALEDWGMQISISKTKYLQCGRAQHSGEPKHIAQHVIGAGVKVQVSGQHADIRPLSQG